MDAEKGWPNRFFTDFLPLYALRRILVRAVCSTSRAAGPRGLDND